jgi:hypothetical protein
MFQIGLGEGLGSALRVSPTWEIWREVGPIGVTCQILVGVLGGSLRRVRWYQVGCPRSFAAEGLVRMTVYGPIHLGWRDFGCSCLRRTLLPGDRGHSLVEQYLIGVGSDLRGLGARSGGE